VGSSKTSFYDIISLNGFNGTITVTPFIQGVCIGNTTCNFSITTTPISVGPGGNATGQITINAGTGTIPGTYKVVFTASTTTSPVFHQATMTLTITSASTADFTINANPRSLTITRGSTGFVNITLTSIGGFSGTILLTGSVIPKIVGAPTVQII